MSSAKFTSSSLKSSSPNVSNCLTANWDTDMGRNQSLNWKTTLNFVMHVFVQLQCIILRRLRLNYNTFALLTFWLTKVNHLECVTLTCIHHSPIGWICLFHIELNKRMLWLPNHTLAMWHSSVENWKLKRTLKLLQIGLNFLAVHMISSLAMTRSTFQGCFMYPALLLGNKWSWHDSLTLSKLVSSRQTCLTTNWFGDISGWCCNGCIETDKWCKHGCNQCLVCCTVTQVFDDIDTVKFVNWRPSEQQMLD